MIGGHHPQLQVQRVGAGAHHPADKQLVSAVGIPVCVCGCVFIWQPAHDSDLYELLSISRNS